MDELFSYMMIIVAIVIIILLIIFATQHMPNQELKNEQNIIGEKLELITKIENLCRACLDKGPYEQDCFIVNLNLKSGNISQEDFKKEKVPINIGEVIEGEKTLKIYSENMVCNIKILS